MAEVADLEAGLRAFLLADPATLAVTGGRIFGGELPESETANMARTAIVVKSSGGIQLLAESFVEHDTQRVDVFAFGPTPHDAAAVMRTAAMALRSLRRSVHAGVLLHWATPASGSLSGREPETEWPRQFQSFQVMHGLLTIEE